MMVCAMAASVNAECGAPRGNQEDGCFRARRRCERLHVVHDSPAGGVVGLRSHRCTAG